MIHVVELIGLHQESGWLSV